MARQEDRTAAPPPRTDRPRVLLVDDAPDVANTLAHILRQEQYDVDVAAGAGEALRALDGPPYDVILTELELTQSDGLSLIDEVRRRAPTTCCIVLTGYASLESAVAALRRGAYDFLVKPCVIEDLEQTIARAIDQRRLGLLAAQRERELKELNDQLEARVAARTAELTEANHRLAEANATKDRFLATLSHELRTPLTPLRAGLELLRERASDDLRPVLEAMERNLAQEARLIDDLLDIARITAGKLSIDRRPVDLETCLRAAADMIRPRAGARGQMLAVSVRDSIPSLLADPVRLQQVVANLLDNAVKFAPQQGHVELAAWLVEGDVVLQVTDDGPGIDPTFLPFVFEPFRQADSSSRRQHGGIGLGLAIARQIARLHGGNLTAANRTPGPGACFTFRFPLVPAPPESARPACSPPPGPKTTIAGRRLLLVDDSLDTVQVLGRLLALHGLRIDEASSVAQALERARAEIPDVIITDIGMPGQNGYDLLREVQADEQLRQVPVIAATGYVGSQEQEQMAEAGFAATLSKPFDLTELLAALERVCRR
jgi:signal transduction histidine kinase